MQPLRKQALYGPSTNKHTLEDYMPSAAVNRHPPIVLVGLDAIAKAVGAGHIALRRWIKEENFPAKRCTDGIYRAAPEAVRQWFAK